MMDIFSEQKLLCIILDYFRLCMGKCMHKWYLIFLLIFFHDWSIMWLLFYLPLIRISYLVSKYEGNLVVGVFNFLTNLIKDSSNIEKYVQCKMIMIYLHSLKEFELEFSGSSKPELWRFQAEPSWGKLIFELKPSWQFWQYVCQKIAILCLYHHYDMLYVQCYEFL